MLKMGRKDFR